MEPQKNPPNETLPATLEPMKQIDTTPASAVKKKGPFAGFGIGSMLMGILDGGVIKQVAAIVSNAFDKFAGKMKSEECLVAVPSGDKTKLRIMKGTYEVVDVNTITIHLEPDAKKRPFSIETILAGIDTSKMGDLDKQKMISTITEEK